MLLAAVWCVSRACRSWRVGGAVGAARPGRSQRLDSGRLMVSIGQRFPASLHGWSPPWSAAADSITRGAAASGLAQPEIGPFRLGAATVFAAVGVLGAVAIGGAVGFVAGIVLVGFGLAYPDLWLRTAAARRTERIERRAPLVLDLVAAGVAAGIDLDAAMRGAAQSCTGPLRDELELVQANVDLGRTRRDELRDAAARTGSRSLAGLAMAVSLSDRLGVPLAETLQAEAGRTRADRARAVQERAAAAGPKVLVVVVFVLVPAALLPLVAAVALSVAGAFGGAGW